MKKIEFIFKSTLNIKINGHKFPDHKLLPCEEQEKTSIAAQPLVQLIQESRKHFLNITQSTKLLQGPFCQELVLPRAPQCLCYFPSETSSEVLGNLSVKPVVLHPAA